MPRFFLKLRDGTKLLDGDGEAQEFSDVEDARRTATEAARELLSQAALNGKAGSLDMQIEVTDEAGTMLFTVPVGHVTDTESQT